MSGAPSLLSLFILVGGSVAVADPVELTEPADLWVLEPVPGTYMAHNVGSPSVVWDPDAALFVMYFEWRGPWGLPERCADGAGTTWGIGRATSKDGLSWVADPEPVLSPRLDSFYACAAVQPEVVRAGPGQWHLWFKGWQEADGSCDPATAPPWGCATVTGIGHASSEDGITWRVEDQHGEALPALSVQADPTPEDFGFPRVVEVSGTWLMFFNYGNNGITVATAPDPAGPWSWEGWTAQAGYSEVIGINPNVSWMSDELLVPEVLCRDEADGAEMLRMYLGAHDRDPEGIWTLPPLSRSVVYAEGWSVDQWDLRKPRVRVWDRDAITADVAWRSWTALAHGDDTIVYFHRMGPDGNRIGLAYSTPDTAWSPERLGEQRCTFHGAPPLAFDDAYIVREDRPSRLEPGVLANDRDAERNPLQLIVVERPAHGTLSTSPDGGAKYTPDRNYNGPDSFRYAAGDGASASTPATVWIEVLPEPDPPIAVHDRYAMPSGGILVVDERRGLLKNDRDPDGDPLSARVVEWPVHGKLTVTDGGALEFHAIPGFVGEVWFTYEAWDGALASEPVDVRIRVTPAP